MTKPLSFRPDAETAALIASMPGATTGEKIRALLNANAETARRINAMNHALVTLAQRLDKMPSTAPQTAVNTPSDNYITTAEFRAALGLIGQALGFVLAGVEQPSSINREGYRQAVYQAMQTIRKGAE